MNVKQVLFALAARGFFYASSESVAFDTGYAGSNGLEPQSWVNGNGTSYIYFGSGEFDGQGSGHDYLGTLYMPSTGSINNCDGGRSHTYCDYRQERALSESQCDASLGKDRCDLCRERTHRFVCSSCVKCASDTSACTPDCEHQGFKSGTNKCLVCPAIEHCPRKATSCTVNAQNVVVANTATCAECKEGFQKVAGHLGTSSDRCVKQIAIDNCKTLGDCTLNADKTGCVPGSQVCSECKHGFKRFASDDSTKNDRCVAGTIIPITPIPFCAVHAGCKVNAEGTGCKAGTNMCKTCNHGFLKVDNSNDDSKDDACIVGRPIANCARLEKCVVNADGTGCKAGTQTCASCAPGFMKVDNSGDASKDDACVPKLAVSNCATLGDCTLTADKSGCKPSTQLCAACKTGFRRVSGSGSDTCVSCISAAGACGAGCGKDQGVYTDGNNCVKCDSTTPEEKCVAATCGQHVKFAWGKCRVNDETTTIVGRHPSDYSTCAAFSGDNAAKWQFKTCAEAFVKDDLTACTACSEDMCTKGLCNYNLKLQSGKCSAPVAEQQPVDVKSSAVKATSVGLATVALGLLY